MVAGLIALILLPAALLLALPAVCDLWAWVRARRVPSEPMPAQPGEVESPPLLFLMPAHNEEKLVHRSIASLRAQRYPCEQIAIAVVADNCDDRTAEQARQAGALVLERKDEARRGKHHAIGWALERIPLDRYAAVIIVDADTVVAPDFARAISRWAPLETMLIQGHVGMSNERENWLTRLAGLLMRSRWGIVMRLKTLAGLNCPLTGDGSVLGTRVLREHAWRVETITEGWELYAKLTLEGRTIRYEPRARIYAQEARSLGQSASQRQRWTSGRLAVLRRSWWQTLMTPGIPVLQRLDLIAELSALGPFMRAFLGVVGLALVVVLHPAGSVPLAALFTCGFAQTGLYTVIALARHEEPGATLLASLHLPVYAVWRVGLGFRSFLSSGTARWVRTERHEEPQPVAVREGGK